MVYATVRTILHPLFRGKVGSIIGAEYLPAHGPYLLAANHIDFLDGFYVALAVHESRGHDVFFLTKSNNYWWTRVTLPIDDRKRSESLDDAVQYLHQGKIICNFIEGARNPLSHLLRGKTGTARLALLANVPVIPVGIASRSGKNFMRSVTNLIAERGNVAVKFGPAIDLEQFRGKEIDYALLQDATREIMRGLVPLTEKVYIG